MNQLQHDEIKKWVSTFENTEIFLKQLDEVVLMASEEEKHLFGESLPSGLVLRD